MQIEKEKATIFSGGTIVTMEDDIFAESIAIRGERIIAVGTLNKVKKQILGNYDMRNLEGNTLLPGFIDCHLHPVLYLFYKLNPDLSKVTNLNDLKSILKEASKNKEEDDVILGFNLNEEIFDNPILPTRWDLDEACPNHPVFVIRYDSHIGIANSKALKLAKITKETEGGERGEIRKNEKGELTGVLSEHAMSPIFSLLTRSIKVLLSSNQLKKKAEEVFKEYAKNGITSLHGILNYDKGGEFGEFGVFELEMFKVIREFVLQNWYAMIFTNKLSKLKKVKEILEGDDGSEKIFKVGTLKLFLDGSFGAKTACMFEPFSDAPNLCGFCVVDEEDIYEKMKFAHNNGFQICIHAIGDKGCKIATDLYRRLLQEFPRDDHRHRIEHASILISDVIESMSNLKLIASCQPPFINSEFTWLEKRLGKERLKNTYPFKSLIDSGVLVVSGSDCPIEDTSIIQGLHALVHRNDFVPEQCIDIVNALKTYTINAAFAAFEEDIKGSIKVGKLADFVILDKNPLDTIKDEIRNIKVLETIIRGKTVFKM